MTRHNPLNLNWLIVGETTSRGQREVEDGSTNIFDCLHIAAQDMVDGCHVVTLKLPLQVETLPL